jgi:hypothetical protein
MVRGVEKLPCVTINSDGTVRIVANGRTVDLSYADYLIAIQSGKSPFSRVFDHNTPPIMVVRGGQIKTELDEE